MKEVIAVKVERIMDFDKWDEDRAAPEPVQEFCFRRDLAPGSFCFTNGTDDQIAALDYVCPCGCGKVGTLPIKKGYGGDSWSWDGNTEKPTLTPSILRIKGCGYHGFLTAGVFKEC